MSRLLSCGLVAVLLMLGAAARADDAVARIDGAELSAADVRGLLDALDPASRAKLLGDRVALGAFLRNELGRRALLDAARQAKWEQRPDVQAKLARAHDDTLMTLYLNAMATPPANYPSDQDIKRAYDGNMTRFMRPRQYHLGKIFVARKDDAQANAQHAKAEDLARKARAAGADFAALAKTGSDDPESAPRGGDLGWLPEDNLIPEIAGTVKSMAERDVSAPIAIKDGWVIITELGTKPAGPIPLDEVKPALINYLRQQRSLQDAQAYVDTLLKQRNVAVNEIALGKLLQDKK